MNNYYEDILMGAFFSRKSAEDYILDKHKFWKLKTPLSEYEKGNVRNLVIKRCCLVGDSDDD